ncbi:MAG: guanylate kinase [Actinomycetota bacterium]|nr:guanylate kinase [Actinomycetota bacterium]
MLVVTGPSGVGKGTLIRALRERFPGLELSVSATTRPQRPGEVDGRDYWFLSPEEFERRVAEDAFLEHATYAGNRYGTPRSEIERAAPPASDDSAAEVTGLVLEIEVEGARQVRTALPEAVQVFVAPPSLEALRARLEGRGSDSPRQVEERLEVARRELGARDEFEHVIVNDRLERAAEELAELVARVWGPPAKGT